MCDILLGRLSCSSGPILLLTPRPQGSTHPQGRPAFQGAGHWRHGEIGQPTLPAWPSGSGGVSGHCGELGGAHRMNQTPRG